MKVWIYKGEILPTPKEEEEDMFPIEVTVKAAEEPVQEDEPDVTAEKSQVQE